MNRFIFLLFLFIASIAEAQTSAMHIADSLYAVGNYSEAVGELKKIPKEPEVQLKLARAQKANGNIVEALQTYDKVLKEQPEKIPTVVEYAALLSSAGQLEKADSIFSRLVKAYPANAGFHYQLALVREKKKDSTALKHYEFTVLLQGTHQQALIKVAEHYLRKGKTVKTEFLCKQGLQSNPGNIALRSLLAQSYYFQKEFQLSTDEFEKIVSLGSGNEFVHTKIARAYLHLRKYHEAIAHYNNALEYENQNPATHFNLGKLYAQVGSYKESEGHLLTAISLKDPLLDDEFFSLGYTYKLLKKPEQALRYFNKALVDNPEHERAMFERALVADSYYSALEKRLDLYEQYLNSFENSGDPRLIRLARVRVQDIKEEMHLKVSAPD